MLWPRLVFIIIIVIIIIIIITYLFWPCLIGFLCQISS